MKISGLITVFIAGLSLCATAQSGKPGMSGGSAGSQNQTNNRPSTTTNNNNNNGGVDISAGIREALKVGTQKAASTLHKPDGFFGNQLIKILLPPEVRPVETQLRSMGFGKQCDNLVRSLNRAAEDAAGQAGPIFVRAITTMSITDGVNIVRGGNRAATDFLQRTTNSALTEAMRPIIGTSLDKVGASKAWRELFTLYNRLPIARKKVNPDLVGYVTERSLNGLFMTVADEEAKIRANPAGQANNLIKNVFGRGGN
jgi:hypothetical protein